MKKVLLMMFALICFGVTANAQVCKISDSNDSVEVFSSYIDVSNNQIVVTVGNDSNEISANVTLTVTVNVLNGNKWENQTLTGKSIAEPNRTTTVTTKPNGKLTELSKIKEVKISGTKCR